MLNSKNELSIKEYLSLKNSQEPHVLVDVRQPDEYQEVAMPDAVLMPLDVFEKRFHELDKSKTIVLQCRSGVRSLAAQEILRKAGFNKTYNLTGGILAWLDFQQSQQ